MSTITPSPCPDKEYFLNSLSGMPGYESLPHNGCDFNSTEPGAKNLRILSIDGGGVRGIIPARILQEVEARTHRATAELFDLMAGCSTGALVALGLNNAPNGQIALSAKDIVQAYLDNVEIIFPNPAPTWGIFAPKYYATGLDQVITQLFQDTLLSDNYTDFFVPAFETTEYKPWHFTRSQIHQHPEWATLTNRDVLRATTAAPVYFPSAEVKVGERYYNFVDGGVFANNPSLFAAVYAQEVYRPCNIDLLCSLGSGAAPRSISHWDSAGWGLYGWGFNISQMIISAQSDSTDQAMHYLLPHNDDSHVYHRFQPELCPSLCGLDASDEFTMRYLLDCAEEEIEDHNDEINGLCEQLLYDVNDGL